MYILKENEIFIDEFRLLYRIGVFYKNIKSEHRPKKSNPTAETLTIL
jgi:hypothetical protein